MLVVGSLLIYFIYGAGAALLGLACLVVGLVPVLLVLLALWLLDVAARRAHER